MQPAEATMAFIKVFDPVSVPLCVLEELQQLRAQVEPLRQENERLRQENERLRRELEEARARLDQAQRPSKRQAAPFSKGRRTARPKRPGRKPGQGRFAFRTLPTPDQWTAPPIEVRLPAPICPCCGEPLQEQRVDFAAVTDIPPQPRPIVQPYRVWVYR